MTLLSAGCDVAVNSMCHYDLCVKSVFTLYHSPQNHSPHHCRQYGEGMRFYAARLLIQRSISIIITSFLTSFHNTAVVSVPFHLF